MQSHNLGWLPWMSSHGSTAAKVIAGVVVFYIVYRILINVTLWRKHAVLRRQRGALEAPRLPQKDPVFGIDLWLQSLRADADHTFLEVSAQRFRNMRKNTYQMHVFGRKLHVTIEPEILKTIQATDFKNWGLGTRRKAGFRPLLGKGIFTTDGHEWQHSREMLRPNFVRSQVGDTATLETHIGHLIAAIPRNSQVNLSELFFRLTIDSATEFLFGESTESLIKDTAVGFATSFNRGQDYIANNTRMSSWDGFFFAKQRFEKDRKFVHEFVDYFVQKSLAQRDLLLLEKSQNNGSGRYVFINELVRQTSDPIRIRSECLNILLAGRDTTASLLTNTWFVLARRPDIWTKLQSEVATLNGALPTFEQLKELKFLRAILNESLRLHPVVPLNSREAHEDTILPIGGGPDGLAPLLIAKGTIMAWNLYAMHRRKDYFGEDAEDFRPERWLDDPETGKKGLRTGWEYLPFNGGARICLGQQYALTEATYTTVRMCQEFSGIENCDPEPWQASLHLTCVSLNGAKVALTSRKI